MHTSVCVRSCMFYIFYIASHAKQLRSFKRMRLHVASTFATGRAQAQTLIDKHNSELYFSFKHFFSPAAPFD